MNPKFSWKIDTFDSDILGFSCAKISCLDNGNLGVSELITDLEREKIVYAVVRIPGSDYPTAQLLERYEFRIVDCLVEMSMDLVDVGEKSIQNIREASRNDSKKIEEIASESFLDTRFFHDTAIPKEAAKKIYSEWAKNSVLGKAADRVIVWDKAGKVEGFATIQKNGHIPLVAVARGTQGKGMGKDLCLGAIQVCKEFGVSKAKIETQTNNVPAMRAYLSSGFKIINSYLTFSWHAKS